MDRGTFTLMASFAQAYQQRFGCSIYDPLKSTQRPGATE